MIVSTLDGPDLARQREERHSLSFGGALVATRPDVLIQLLGAAGTVRVWYRLGSRALLALDPVQDGRENLAASYTIVSKVREKRMKSRCSSQATRGVNLPSTRGPTHRRVQSWNDRLSAHRG